MTDLTVDGGTTDMFLPACSLSASEFCPQGSSLHSRIPLSLWNTARHIFDFSGPKSCSCSCMLGPAEAWANRAFKLRDWGGWDGKLSFSGLRCHYDSTDRFDV